MTNGDIRAEAIRTWLQDSLGLRLKSLAPASNDASFRRYFRAVHDGGRHIVMDAPPERENVAAFVKVAKLFKGVPIHVPDIYRQDLAQGFLLLEDFGDRNLQQQLSDDNADALYAQALASLFKLQTGVDVAGCGLPGYDAALLRRELGIFREWLLQGLLKLEIDAATDAILQDAEARLIASALEQPQACVHRDYHSRNLMYLGDCEPGVLDFQDAVVGPVTYDLASLLRDCYVAWPQERVALWMNDYYRRLLQAGMVHCDLPTFRRWFDWMGMQRHLKAAGIFARLHLRDGKPNYLGDIPRTIAYVLDVSRSYAEFAQLHDMLCTLDIPRRLPL